MKLHNPEAVDKLILCLNSELELIIL